MLGNTSAVYNLGGTVVGNGLVSFITDGHNKNGIENRVAFNNAPLSMLEEYKRLGCSLTEERVKTKPIINKPECQKYLDYILNSMKYVNFQDQMATIVVNSTTTLQESAWPQKTYLEDSHWEKMRKLKINMD